LIRGLYSCANGLLAESARTDVIASNLAGLSVPGFRREVPVVSAFARTLDYLSGGSPAGAAGPSALLISTVKVDLQFGPVRATGGRLDLALEGPGYFCVQTPSGEAYTRGGALRLDSARRLVTAAGDPVLGAAGPVQLPAAGELEITGDGDIIVDGARVDRLKLVDLPPSAEVEKLGRGLLRLTAGAPSATTAGRVRQGYLEGANVEAVQELAAMIAALRAFEANQRALQANDETLDKAINEIGRV
jgi:flagellar basal-body rod protein FlgG